MQPTYNINVKSGNDVVYVNSLDTDYEYGDIIVIDVGNDDPIIKRVIGLPGDIIDLVFDEESGYKLEINGQIIEESYLNYDYKLEPMNQNGLYKTYKNFHQQMKVMYPELFETGKLVVPDGEVFALGDNRHDSQDSTYYGTFNKSIILGIVEFNRFYGVSEFDFFWNYIMQGKFVQTIINCF